MPRSLRVWSEIRVVGKIWMPATTCAMHYTLDTHQIVSLLEASGKQMVGELTREDIEEHWIGTHTGDFQSITDFYADLHYEGSSLTIDWQSEDNENTYMDATYGDG